jgi:hypothetical protein
MIFKVINKLTQDEVYRYESDESIEWEGMDFSTHEHIAILNTPPTEIVTTVYGGRRKLTKLEFIELLGPVAYQTILTMSHTSVVVESEVKKFELATPDLDGTSVNLDDQRTIFFIQSIAPVLEAQGIVTSNWAESVLNG